MQSQAKRTMQRLLSTAGRRFEGLDVDGVTWAPKDIIEVLRPFVSDERVARISDVLDGRTYRIAPVVEGLANTGNVSAVMRTAEGLGLQGFHIVAGTIPMKHSVRTTQGAHKWLDVATWETPDACVDALHAEGYRVLVTHLDDRARPIDEVDFSGPVALVFGNEKHGVSPRMVERADETVLLPSPGFVQSYNISVAASMALYHARNEMMRLTGHFGDLTPDEKERLTADFFIRSVRTAVDILRRITPPVS